MNGIQTLSAALPGSTPVGASSPVVAADGSTSESTPFAALMLGLLHGESDSNASLGMTLSNLIAGAAPVEMNTVEGAAGEELSETDLLAQLIAWFNSLTPETKELLTSNEQLGTWMAQAEAELAMAATSTGSMFSESDLEIEETDSKPKTLGETLQRLLTALQDNPDQSYLIQVTQQVKSAITQAASSIGIESPVANVLGAQGADKAARETGSAQNKTLLRDIGVLFDKTNGAIVEGKAQKPEFASNVVRMDHLSAMQAKSSFVRFLSSEGMEQSTSTEAGMQVKESKAPSIEGTPLASNLSESIKPTSTETALKTDAAPQRVPISNVADQLNQWLMKQTGAGKDNLMTQTVIKLVPEHLGQVEVKLSIHNGQLTAMITTESAVAKDVLESNLAVLRANLQNQGITVEKLAVTQQPELQSGMFHDGRKHQSSGRESGQDQHGRQDDGGEDWTDVLSLSALEEASKIAGAYGSSFHAEA